jgi:hypothetical protein
VICNSGRPEGAQNTGTPQCDELCGNRPESAQRLVTSRDQTHAKPLADVSHVLAPYRQEGDLLKAFERSGSSDTESAGHAMALPFLRFLELLFGPAWEVTITRGELGAAAPAADAG